MCTTLTANVDVPDPAVALANTIGYLSRYSDLQFAAAATGDPDPSRVILAHRAQLIATGLLPHLPADTRPHADSEPTDTDPGRYLDLAAECLAQVPVGGGPAEVEVLRTELSDLLRWRS